MIIKFLLIFLCGNFVAPAVDAEGNSKTKLDIDPNGYIFFCLCMGKPNILNCFYKTYDTINQFPIKSFKFRALFFWNGHVRRASYIFQITF